MKKSGSFFRDCSYTRRRERRCLDRQRLATPSQLKRIARPGREPHWRPCRRHGYDFRRSNHSHWRENRRICRRWMSPVACRMQPDKESLRQASAAASGYRYCRCINSFRRPRRELGVVHARAFPFHCNIWPLAHVVSSPKFNVPLLKFDLDLWCFRGRAFGFPACSSGHSGSVRTFARPKGQGRRVPFRGVQGAFCQPPQKGQRPYLPAFSKLPKRHCFAAESRVGSESYHSRPGTSPSTA
jgi:hypothetical protein